MGFSFEMAAKIAYTSQILNNRLIFEQKKGVIHK